MSSMNYRNIKITILVSRKIPTRAISKAFNLSTERVLGLAKDISGQLLDMSITSTDQVRLFAPEIFQASAMRVDLARRRIKRENINLQSPSTSPAKSYFFTDGGFFEDSAISDESRFDVPRVNSHNYEDKYTRCLNIPDRGDI